MNIDAQILARMNMPYAVATLRFNLQTFVLLSPEDHGPALLVDAETWQVVRTLDTPGGTMDMVQHFPDGPIYAVMNCFLGYKFQDAAIYTLQPQKPQKPSGLEHCQSCRPALCPPPAAPFHTRQGIPYCSYPGRTEDFPPGLEHPRISKAL